LYVALVTLLVGWIKTTIKDMVRSEREGVSDYSGFSRLSEKALSDLMFMNPTPDHQGRTPALSTQYAHSLLSILY
jgi:hypothetical protein